MRCFIACLVLVLFAGPAAGAGSVFPCCHLTTGVSPIEHHFPVLNLTDIRIGMCQGLHLADLESMSTAGRVKLLRCGNGYGVVSFLVSLLEEVCARGASEAHLALLRDLRRVRDRFDPARGPGTGLGPDEGP